MEVTNVDFCLDSVIFAGQSTERLTLVSLDHWMVTLWGAKLACPSRVYRSLCIRDLQKCVANLARIGAKRKVCDVA